MSVLPDELPVCALFEPLRAHFQSHRNALICAQTGSGKTTALPLALLDAPFLHGRKIIMLEPRRLAAKLAAEYMARTLGEEVGKTIGYAVRGERCVSAQTRLEIVTEALLTRRIQADPELSGVGLLIFDEFHERSLHADLALALALDVQNGFNEAIKIAVMSATLESAPLLERLPDCALFEAPGRLYEVKVIHMGRPGPYAEDLLKSIVSGIIRAYHETSGDILVFLPGMGEMVRAKDRVDALHLPGAQTFLLHGTLSKEQQHQAVTPLLHGRKIILSSAVAESSVTLPNITAVVDSALERSDVFSPGSGMNVRVTRSASKSSLEQRKGRAGRLGPGLCYRLTDPIFERTLPPYAQPGILSSDLAPMQLELALWGCANQPQSLTWLDPPPEAAYAVARELLINLDALDDNGLITALGRRIAPQGIHPRLARMILSAQTPPQYAAACDLAALLSEANLPLKDPSIRAQLQCLSSSAKDLARDLRKGCGVRPCAYEESDWIELLLRAFPDRVAHRRSNSDKYLLSNGRGVRFFDRSSLHPTIDCSKNIYLLVPRFSDNAENGIIELAITLEIDFMQTLKNHIQTREICAWDDEKQRVSAVQRETLGALTLCERPLKKWDHALAYPILIEQLKMRGLEALSWTPDMHNLCLRATFLNENGESFPDLSDAALIEHIAAEPKDFFDQAVRLSDVPAQTIREFIRRCIGYEKMRKLDELAPETIEVPSGSKIKVQYDNPALGPYMAVRLQELFGWFASPRICSGKVPVTLQMLSPAMRPVQTTRDLQSFWREGYFLVRKDLRGRYPKHYWPEDPLNAEAIRGSRKRKT